MAKLRDAGRKCDKFEWHHIFPQAFRNDFLEIGINIDRYTIALCPDEHRSPDGGVHSKDADYNGQWNDFFDRDLFDKELTPEQAKTLSDEAVMKAVEMLDENGKTGDDYQVCAYPR